MLARFRYDNRIGHISGSNFQNGIKRGTADYYFSKLTNVWGWASWRRVWDNYDINMSSLDLFIKDNLSSVVSPKNYIKQAIENNFIQTKNSLINTWDYQYFYSNIMSGYLSIIPNYNLVINIGFGEAATHTKNKNDPNMYRKLNNLPYYIQHPKYFQANIIADEYTFKETVQNFLLKLKNKLF
jgi:hypothetical protein